jgi:hypothetical protein
MTKRWQLRARPEHDHRRRCESRTRAVPAPAAAIMLLGGAASVFASLRLSVGL